MNSKTKILVFRMKELIYTGIFVALGILLVILLILLLRSDKSENTPSVSPETNTVSTGETDAQNSRPSTSSTYIPGVYNTALALGSYTVNLEVTVDSDYISSIRLVNLDESVATMYPLLEPAVESLTSQICEKQSLENITYAADNKYTMLVLLKAVETTLEKASVQ